MHFPYIVCSDSDNYIITTSLLYFCLSDPTHNQNIKKNN